MQQQSSFNRAVNSAVATGIAEVLTLPICTIKTVYQNTSSNSIIETANEIYRRNGLKSFYKASVPAISSQMFSTSSKFVFYRKLEDLQLPHSNKIVNGIIGGVASSLLTHPLDAVKVHLQMNTSFAETLRKTGLSLFYRGYSKTFSKVLVGSALFFPLTDYSRVLTNGNVMLASFLSGTISTLIIHPIDYLKTRHIYNQPLYQGLNPRIYYKGLSLNLLRVVQL